MNPDDKAKMIKFIMSFESRSGIKPKAADVQVEFPCYTRQQCAAVIAHCTMKTYHMEPASAIAHSELEATTRRNGPRSAADRILCKSCCKKHVSGTKEWSSWEENILLGCEHDCRYCYAKSMALRFKRSTPERWRSPVINPTAMRKHFRKKKGRGMFPTAHDITPAFLGPCMERLRSMLTAGNSVLIVTKPHVECIRAICEECAHFKTQILFRFTIGSADDATLKFWEPGAPSFEERIESLRLAHALGFETSVSCEPMLDNRIDMVIDRVSPFVTDAIWLGKANMLRQRLSSNGFTDPETAAAADQLIAWQFNAEITNLYEKYKSNRLIKFKESIKKVVGLTVATEAGSDM